MKWEYHAFKIEAEGWFSGGKLDPARLEAELNRLGEAGWELVSVFDTNMHQGGTRDVHVVMKRRKA